jgi:hypothetical protein
MVLGDAKNLLAEKNEELCELNWKLDKIKENISELKKLDKNEANLLTMREAEKEKLELLFIEKKTDFLKEINIKIIICKLLELNLKMHLKKLII